MLVSISLGALALCGVASALPAADTNQNQPQVTPAPVLAVRGLEKRVDATAPWVYVDDEAQPETTHTPSLTVISGSTSVIDAAAHDLTASVYTFTSWGAITTSTGEPPNPTATGKHGEGVFTRCYNMDGKDAPFCRPFNNSTLLTGNTYFITWDPDYYNKTHSTTNLTSYDVSVRLDYLNTTSKEWVKLDHYAKVPSNYGFWPLKVDKSLLKGHKKNNVTISLYSSLRGTNGLVKTNNTLNVAITEPGFPQKSNEKLPEGQTLTIALPVVFGSIAFILIGLCLWNRKTRRIQLGNIMSRSRHGYSGRSERRRIFRSNNKDNGIHLDTSPTYPDEDADGNVYHDLPERQRRDSDALGSLAGSPVEGSFQQQGTRGGRNNTFRDEVARQESERRHGERF